MNLYQRIKAAVTTRQAAESYGLKVSPSGMALCPFHDDHHPSLKLDKANMESNTPSMPSTTNEASAIFWCSSIPTSREPWMAHILRNKKIKRPMRPSCPDSPGV